MEPVIRRTRAREGRRPTLSAVTTGTSALVTDEEALCKAEESEGYLQTKGQESASRDGESFTGPLHLLTHV